MSTQRLVWHEGQRYTGFDSWGNEVQVDGDPDSGRGSKPSDLLPVSLAVCTAYTLIDVLKKRRQNVRSLEATIETTQEEEPPWTFTRIDVHFAVTGDVEPAKAEKSLALAHEKYCSVAATLAGTVQMDFTIEVKPD